MKRPAIVLLCLSLVAPVWAASPALKPGTYVVKPCPPPVVSEVCAEPIKSLKTCHDTITSCANDLTAERKKVAGMITLAECPAPVQVQSLPTVPCVATSQHHPDSSDYRLVASAGPGASAKNRPPLKKWQVITFSLAGVFITGVIWANNDDDHARHHHGNRKPPECPFGDC